MRKIICLGVLFAFIPSVAFAWNRGGHLTTGAIAYQELVATNPEAVARIVEIMKSTPTPLLFEGRLEEESTPEAKAERLFMEMATWPDEIRPPSTYSKSFHHDSWHWANFVYVPEGTPETFIKPDEISADRIYEAFAKNAAIVSDPKVTDAEKAVALCWVFHLVGDVHQPLHTTAMFNSDFPDGDKGGNLTKIRVKPDAKIINLHSFWDGAVIGTSNIKSVRNKSVELRRNHSMATLPQFGLRPYDGSATFEAWGRQESSPLAILVAYDISKLFSQEKTDGVYDLSPEYILQTKSTADTQLTLAGYRLAAIVGEIMKVAPYSGTSSAH
jgi:hypothetical protein